MKFLVFSDIHGNLEAIEEVLGRIDVVGPDMVVCLGDVVGYGADPGKCVELVRKHADIIISGNHDMAATGRIRTDGFNPSAREAIKWTAATLEPDHISALRTSVPMRRYEDCLFTHATPISPLDWEYVYTVAQAREIFLNFSEKFIFIGHTHIPAIIRYTREQRAVSVGKTLVEVEPECRYLINTGSVGQPRDGSNGACYTILDTSRGIIDQRRINYDFSKAQDKILKAGLPEILAARLANGE